METWEGICDSVETLINEGQKTCDTRWSYPEDFLTYLDLPVLEPISHEPSPKLQLEKLEQHFDTDKELIHQINLITMQEMKIWIEAPHASITRIQAFVKKWKNIKKREISSHICKMEVHLRHAHF